MSGPFTANNQFLGVKIEKKKNNLLEICLKIDPSIICQTYNSNWLYIYIFLQLASSLTHSMPEHQWDGPIVVLVPDGNRAPGDQQHRSSQEKSQKDAGHFLDPGKEKHVLFMITGEASTVVLMLNRESSVIPSWTTRSSSSSTPGRISSYLCFRFSISTVYSTHISTRLEPRPCQHKDTDKLTEVNRQQDAL